MRDKVGQKLKVTIEELEAILQDEGDDEQEQPDAQATDPISRLKEGVYDLRAENKQLRHELDGMYGLHELREHRFKELREAHEYIAAPPGHEKRCDPEYPCNRCVSRAALNPTEPAKDST